MEILEIFENFKDLKLSLFEIPSKKVTLWKIAKLLNSISFMQFVLLRVSPKYSNNVLVKFIFSVEMNFSSSGFFS